MVNPLNEVDIYCAISNTNTQRQDNKIMLIIKKRNSSGWKIVSTSTEY